MTEVNITPERDLFNKSPSVIQRGKRLLFSAHALEQLEKYFALNQYPTTAEREKLASIHNTKANKIQFWFQNRRYKSRKQTSSDSAQKPNRISKVSKGFKQANCVSKDHSIADDFENNSSQSNLDSSKISQQLNTSLNDSTWANHTQHSNSISNNNYHVPLWSIYSNLSNEPTVSNINTKPEKPLFRPYL